MKRWSTRRRHTDDDLLTTASDTAPTPLPKESAADDRNEMYGRRTRYQCQLMLIIVTHTDTWHAPEHGET